MQAHFYATMRTIIGVPSLDVDDLRIDTIRKLLAFLIESFPNAESHLLDANDELRQDVPVFVNGRNPRLFALGIDTPLNPDAIVSFFSPISSGRMNVEVLRESDLG